MAVPGTSAGALRNLLSARLEMAAIAVALAVAVVPTPAAWVERVYSTQLYVVGQRGVTAVSSLVGFSLLDPLAAGILAGLAAWWWRALRRSGPGLRSRAGAAARMSLHSVAVAAALYLIFVAMWGLNYRREPLAARLDFDRARVSTEALASLSYESVRRLNALYEPARAAAPWPAFEELPERLGPAFESAQRRLGAVRTAVAGRPKATLLGAYFRRAGIDGMVNPFSLEVLVNQGVLPYERPFVVAHEWAHLAGYADEAEANFVGVLVCLAGDAQSRYNAWLFLSQRLVRHLPAADRDRVWAGLDDGPRRDLQAIAARLREAVPVVRRGFTRTYDRFLRANRVDAGINSYGLVVDLLLGTDGTPVWRELAGPLDPPAAPSPPSR